jgi:hypothetical protein
MTAAAGSAPIDSTSIASTTTPATGPSGGDLPGGAEDKAGDPTATHLPTDPATHLPTEPATEPAEHTPGAVDWVLVVAISILTAWAAVLSLAFLPLYVGSVPLPVSALLGVAAMILGPRTCYRLTGSMAAALLPVAAWFGVCVWVVLSYNRILPTVPLTVISGQWRVMVLLGLGALAAAATIGLIWGDRLRDRVAAERAAADPGPPTGAP